LLTGALCAPDAAAKNDDIKIFQFLASTGADPDGTARARWRELRRSVPAKTTSSSIR